MTSYQIGNFSKITQLTVKTLRYYQDAGLLEPAWTDESSGYRYYDEKSFERVRIIKALKEIDFSIEEIRDVLRNCEDDSEILPQIKRKMEEINNKIIRYKKVQNTIETLISKEKNMETINGNTDIEIKNIPDILIAGIRFKGDYQSVGQRFGTLFRKFKRHFAGQTFSLYYDGEYREKDADIEACISIKKEIKKIDIRQRTLKGGEAITLIHKGSYENLGNAYKKLYDYISTNDYTLKLPSREIYIKGPGMIFKGNPDKYITEIQILV